MFGIEVLEVVIGLVFVYLLLSLLATTLNEMVMKWLYSRGTNLKVTLKTMLNDNGSENILCEEFISHPLIQKLTKKEKGDFPAYISHTYFSKVLLELLYPEKGGSLDEIKEGIDRLPESKTKAVLLFFVRDAEGKLEVFREKLEDWYEEMMIQATSWYKQKVQIILFVLGMLISIIVNADTVRIARLLSQDLEARVAMVEQAERFLENHKKEDLRSGHQSLDSLQLKVIQLIEEDIQQSSTALGMGWKRIDYEPIKIGETQVWGWLRAIPGWIATALAITLGAPFWFDLLKKVTNIRANVKYPKDEEA